MDNLENLTKETLGIVANSYEKRLDYQLKPQYVDCKEDINEIILSYPTEQWQLNYGGTMHGGMIATLFDTTLGTLAHVLSQRKPVATVSLNVNYLKPIPADSRVYIKAQAVAIGKTLMHIKGEAYINGNESKIIATSTGVFMVIKKQLSEMSV